MEEQQVCPTSFYRPRVNFLLSAEKTQEYYFCLILCIDSVYCIHLPALWHYFPSSKFRFQLDYVVTVTAKCLVTEFIVKNLNGKFVTKCPDHYTVKFYLYISHIALLQRVKRLTSPVSCTHISVYLTSPGRPYLD